MQSGCCIQESAKSTVLVGRSSDEKELSELVSSARRGDRPCVIFVWGFPGVGKSSLVKAVLSRQEFNQASLFKLYVDVSYPFNLGVFCRSILSFKSQQDHAVPEEKKTDEKIIHECTEFMKGHPCIVVIDGLRFKEDWDSIKNRLIPKQSQTMRDRNWRPEEVNGSRSKFLSKSIHRLIFRKLPQALKSSRRNVE